MLSMSKHGRAVEGLSFSSSAYFLWSLPNGGRYGVRKLTTVKQPAIAKITHPVLKGIVPRKRLFRHLEGSRDRPITWISGPPGCGKTTLVASYLDAFKLPCLWYQIDDGDADISTFFYYMGLAAKKAAPLKRKPMPLLTPEYMLGISTFTLRFFEELYSRLNPTRPPLSKGGDKVGFIIVFDNYQQVPVESKLHEVIAHGLSVIPEKINVIIISRRDPLPQFVQLRASNKVSFLGWDEIKFTLNESRAMVHKKEHKTLTDEILMQLHKKTEGWAAGLVLMMEIAKKETIDYQLPDTITPKEIFDPFSTLKG